MIEGLLASTQKTKGFPEVRAHECRIGTAGDPPSEEIGCLLDLSAAEAQNAQRFKNPRMIRQLTQDTPVELLSFVEAPLSLQEHRPGH